ncbi:MAG: glycosyltransferase family 39 protein [bacterium]
MPRASKSLQTDKNITNISISFEGGKKMHAIKYLKKISNNGTKFIKNIFQQTKIFLINNPLLPLALIVTFFILAFNIDKNPVGFFCDEAQIGIDAYKILTTGKDMHGQSFPLWFTGIMTGGSVPGLRIYSDIPFILLFGLNIFATRIASVFWGLAFMTGLYFLTKLIFNKTAANFSILFLMISPWFLHCFRIAQNWSTYPPTVVLALFLLIKGIREKRYSIFAAGTITAGLVFYTYPVSLFTAPPLFITLGLIFLPELWRNKKYLLTAIIGAMIFILPLIFILNNPIHTRREKQISLSEKISLTNLNRSYKLAFGKAFLFETGSHHERDTPAQNVTDSWGVFPIFFLPFLLFSASAIIRSAFKREYILLVVWIIIYPITGFGAISENWNMIGLPIIVLLTAAGAMFLYKTILSRSLLLSKFFIAAIVLISFINLTNYLLVYHIKYPKQAVIGWQYGPEKIIESFVKNYDQYDDFVMTFVGFNAPEIFFPFFSPHKYEKFHIGLFNSYSNSTKKTLYAMRSDYIHDIENNKSINIVDRVNNPVNNTTLFYIFEVKPSFYSANKLSWLTTRVFPNEYNQIEKKLFTNATYTSEENTDTWKEYKPPSNTLNNSFFIYFYDSYNGQIGCEYAKSQVNMNTNLTGQLRLTSVGGTTSLWLNNNQVIKSAPWVESIDNTIVNVSFLKGNNTLLAKTCFTAYRTRGFFLRITNTDGTSLQDFTSSAPPPRLNLHHSRIGIKR